MTDTEPKPSPYPRLRALLFLLLSLAIGAVLIVAMTWFVIGSAPRSQAVAMAEGIRVAEFVSLPDEDSYPAALAIDAAGTLYTGSYQTGALWSISADGVLSELPGSRERIGAVSGLAAAADGALYILDRIAPLDAQGAVVWRFANGSLTALFTIAFEAFPAGVLPDDIAVDSRDRIYISDRLGQVLRYTAAGAPAGRRGGPIWWLAPCGDHCEITGIAYDRAQNALLIADPANDALYRVAITAGAPNDTSDTNDTSELLRGRAQKNDYGFDGIATSAAGDIFIALLNWNRVARLENGELLMLAQDFRGASDVAFDPARSRLYVSNWNQFSLAFGTRPQLPFAIDVIQLEAAPDQPD